MAGILNSNELRKGTVYIDGRDVFKVLDYKHQKYGRGQATIRVKVKNIHNGSISEQTYDSGAKLAEAETAKRSAQYLYSEGSGVYFMDNSDFSQFSLPEADLEEERKFLKEGDKVLVLYVSGQPVSIELPKAVELKVMSAPPATAGNTATAASKKVRLETGVEVDVPLFVSEGDVVKVNTESGSYIGRV